MKKSGAFIVLGPVLTFLGVYFPFPISDPSIRGPVYFALGTFIFFLGWYFRSKEKSKSNKPFQDSNDVLAAIGITLYLLIIFIIISAIYISLTWK